MLTCHYPTGLKVYIFGSVSASSASLQCTWCIQAAKALTSLLICVGLHKASLLDDVISVPKAPSSQAKGTKSTSFLTRKERSGLSTLGLRRCKIPCACSNIKNEMH